MPAIAYANSNRLLDYVHVLIKAPDGNIVFWNTGMSQLYGWAASQTLGKVGHELFQTEFPVSLADVQAHLLTHGFWDGELVNTRADGSRIVVVSHQMMQRNAQGEPEAVLEVNTDVTALRHAEAARRQNTAELAGIISSAMDAIISVDTNQCIIVFNSAAEIMFGCSATEAIGARIARFIPDRFRSGHVDQLDRFAHTNATSRSMAALGPIFALRCNGQEFPIEATISQTTVDGRIINTAIVRDISQRQRAEEAIRQSEAFSLSVLNSVPSCIAVLDSVGTIVEVNDCWRIFGKSNGGSELAWNPIGKSYLDVCNQAMGSAEANAAGAAHAGIIGVISGELKEFSLEYPFDALNPTRWFSMTVSPMQKSFDGVVVTHTDITERKVAALRSQQRTDAILGMLQSLKSTPVIDQFLDMVLTAMPKYLNGNSVSLWLYNPKLEIITLREALSASAGVASIPGDAMSPVVQLSFHCDDNAVWKSLATLREPIHIEDIALFCGDEYAAWPNCGNTKNTMLVPLLLGDEIIGCIALHGFEPTCYVPADLDLITALSQQVTLAVQMTRMAEQVRQVAVVNERNRMAQDIHDTLAQGFTGILRQLEAASYAPSKNDARDHLAQASELARISLQEARRSVYALRPRALENQRLPEAIRTMIVQSSSGLPIHVDLIIEGDIRTLSPSVEENMFRIAQEALTNGLKHANPTCAAVELHFEPDRVRLIARDNGKGFDVADHLRTDGLGIMGMYERAARIGGEMTLHSRPGEGTEITITLTGESALSAARYTQ
jgi:PAS domain S-box-containing protein